MTDDSFSEVSKCPACYGNNLCQSIETGDIHLRGNSNSKRQFILGYKQSNLGFTSWRISKAFNVKNVFHGFWTSRNTSVIVKKLGYDSELEIMDRRLCEAVSEEAGCSPGEAVTRLVEKISQNGSNRR